jgi:hypothetical protein
METTAFLKQIEVGEHGVYAYLIGDTQTGEALVVDPADDVDVLIGLAAENGLRIGAIVNTHGHVDHIMGNAEMKAKTGAGIIIHEAEAAYLEKIGDFWLEMFAARKSPPADVVVRDGDELTVGAQRWRVLHTPGHTPGSICLYQPWLGVCLTGIRVIITAQHRFPPSPWSVRKIPFLTAYGTFGWMNEWCGELFCMASEVLCSACFCSQLFCFGILGIKTQRC